MTSPLGGCHAKLRRAYQHLQSLDESIQRWGQTNPYAIADEFDPNAGEHVVSISQVRAAPVVDWALITGDALHNLRSTLDHLICTLIKHKEPSHGCFGTGFPVLKDPAIWDFRKGGRLAPNSGLRKLGPIDDAWIIATVRQLQPFVRWKKAGKEEPLWILNELVNADKHRTPNLGQVFLYQPEIIFNPPHGAETVWVKPAGPFESGDELARYRLTRGSAEGDVKAKTNYGVDIVFKDPGPAEGTKVTVMLDWLFDTVVYVVDLFDSKLFGGQPPAGTKQSIIGASRSVTSDSSGSHSSAPEAKRDRWG
jgi:hypothetical protein